MISIKIGGNVVSPTISAISGNFPSARVRFVPSNAPPRLAHPVTDSQLIGSNFPAARPSMPFWNDNAPVLTIPTYPDPWSNTYIQSMPFWNANAPVLTIPTYPDPWSNTYIQSMPFWNANGPVLTIPLKPDLRSSTYIQSMPFWNPNAPNAYYTYLETRITTYVQ